MKKTYEEQVADMRKTEQRVAEKHGMTVAEWREYTANENRKKAYLAKLAWMKPEVEKMEQWLSMYVIKRREQQ